MQQYELNRFWARVNKTDSCWLWTSHCDKDGYGRLWRNGYKQQAHRVSWRIAHGYMPDELVLHKCDVPACVNPEHLFLGTQKDNMHDAVAKGRKGKLSSTDVDEIRRLVEAGVRQKDIARQFDISQQHVNNIVRGYRWKTM
jgi:hypothetical protein